MMSQIIFANVAHIYTTFDIFARDELLFDFEMSP